MCTGLLACQMWGASLRPSQSKPTSEVALRMSRKERVYYVMMKLNVTIALLKIQALYLVIRNLNTVRGRVKPHILELLSSDMI